MSIEQQKLSALEGEVRQLKAQVALLTAVAKGVDNVTMGWEGELLTLSGVRFKAMTNGDAPNNCLYYSTTASKLVYKDNGGVVNNLY